MNTAALVLISLQGAELPLILDRKGALTQLTPYGTTGYLGNHFVAASPSERGQDWLCTFLKSCSILASRFRSWTSCVSVFFIRDAKLFTLP